MTTSIKSGKKSFEIGLSMLLCRMTARSELVSVVTQGLQKISYSSDPVLKDVIEKLQQFLHRFDHLEGNGYELGAFIVQNCHVI